MDSIAIERKNQKKLNKRVKSMKIQLKRVTEPTKKSKEPGVHEKGVIYLGHIPHGFYEDEIREYCSQFGKVTKVRVARSQKTGRSKGYAFVEFLHSEVAKIVAETIDNYLMFDRLLKCQYIPQDKRNKKMFWNSISEFKFPALKNRAADTERKNAVVENEKEEEKQKKTRRKIEDFRKFFEERGIEFNFKVNDPNEGIEVVGQPIPAVLEIDESDDEIEFNTPPHVTKVYKKTPKKNEPRRKRSIMSGLKENKSSGVLKINKGSKAIKAAKKGLNIKNALNSKQKIRH